MWHGKLLYKVHQELILSNTRRGSNMCPRTLQGIIIMVILPVKAQGELEVTKVLES